MQYLKNRLSHTGWGYSALLVALSYTNTTSAELLGVTPHLPLMDISPWGELNYNAGTDQFTVNTQALSIVLPPARTISATNTGSQKLMLQFHADNTGHLTGGVPGDDLVITGSVDLFGDGTTIVNGTLITGEITGFGFKETGGNVDFYDFALRVTGGQLASLYDGYDIGIKLNSEGSTFSGSFDVNFSGKTKGKLGSIPQTLPPTPKIEICTRVTLHPNGSSDLSDADNVSGDGCDRFVQSIPAGPVPDSQGTYQWVITNTGTETLTNVTFSAPEFGLVNESIPGNCGDLGPGDSCTIDSDRYPQLRVPELCASPGRVTRAVSTQGEGISSEIQVTDDDPATVDCVAEPSITLIKEVKMNGGTFLDANTAETGPVGPLGADAIYRLTIRNTGTEPLTNVRVTDESLGILSVPVGVNPLLPGASVVLNRSSSGFSALSAPGRCTSVGAHLNIARVNGSGQFSQTAVTSQDPAYVRCENPQIDLRKQVSLDGQQFFDADQMTDPDVPTGLAGKTSATYRLIVKNVGSELLTDVVVHDSQLGIHQNIGALYSGESRVVLAQDSGFGKLFVLNACPTPGQYTNIATVTAEGADTGTSVNDDNPANFRCISGPEVQIVKEVKLPGGNFMDANTPDTGPKGLLGADSIYRLTVKNVGDEPLTQVTVSDAELGISNVIINDLAPGASKVLRVVDAGFENLHASGRCSSVGTFLNIADVNAIGSLSGATTRDEDPAYLSCEAPVQCNLDVQQTCFVKPVSGDDKMCTASISATTLRYTGPLMSNATVTFAGKDGGSATYTNVDLVPNETILTSAAENGFTLDSGIGQKLGAQTTITINGKQEIIHTSCSAIYAAGQPAPLDSNTPNPPNSTKGAPSPNWAVVDFRQKDDVIMEEEPASGVGQKLCALPYGGGEVTFGYKLTNSGTVPVAVASVTDSVLGELLAQSPQSLAPGAVYELTRGPTLVSTSGQRSVVVEAHAANNTSVACPAVDSVTLEVAAAPMFSCADGKPVKLGITYVGGSCSDSTHSQGSKASCSGNSTGMTPVKLSLTDKSGNNYLSKTVVLGETVVLDASALGKSKLDADTLATIQQDGKTVQSIKMHTSCSAPLLVGDRHGGLVISSFTPENGGSGKGGKGGKGSKGDKGKKGKHDKGKKGK